MSAAKRVLVPVADDSVDIETVCITDGSYAGAEVTVAPVMPSQVRLTRAC